MFLVLFELPHSLLNLNDLDESLYMRGLGFPALSGEGEGRAAEVTG
jgi:hypothetical protein